MFLPNHKGHMMSCGLVHSGHTPGVGGPQDAGRGGRAAPSLRGGRQCTSLSSTPPAKMQWLKTDQNAEWDVLRASTSLLSLQMATKGH